MANDKNKTQAEGAFNANKLDAIKEIIFGQDMVQYEQEFRNIRESIQANVDAINNEFARFNKLMNEMEDRLQKNMDKNHKQLLGEIEKLEDKKLDRKKLAKLLNDVAGKIGE